jgi:2-polyprenyl-3-methyl-5-hydroxy-6-metoxy-1,4-benzoquinol methylase
MEAVKCDLCGADAPNLFLTTTDRFSQEIFHLSRCSQCGLVYLIPRPAAAELEGIYPDDYEAYTISDQNRTAVEQWHIRRAFKLQLKYIHRFLPQRGMLLDVGCATGNFLNAAREYDWKVMGLEVMEKAARVAHEHYGLYVSQADLESFAGPAGSMDAVVLWDVLEHLPSPRRALERIHQLLRPGGMVFFSIPNLVSFDRYLFGKEWIGWDPPRHFTLFDHKTLKAMLASTGFELVDWRCLFGGKGTFLLSLDRLIRKRPGLGWLKRFYPLLGMALWPYRQAAYLLRRGPILFYAVRKVGK